MDDADSCLFASVTLEAAGTTCTLAFVVVRIVSVVWRNAEYVEVAVLDTPEIFSIISHIHALLGHLGSY